MHSGLKFLQLLRSPASSFLATRTSVLTYGHYSSGQCSSSVRRSIQAGYLSSAFKSLRLFGRSYRLWGAWTRSTWLASSDRPSILHSYLMGDWASHDMIDDANPLPRAGRSIPSSASIQVAPIARTGVICSRTKHPPSVGHH